MVTWKRAARVAAVLAAAAALTACDSASLTGTGSAAPPPGSSAPGSSEPDAPGPAPEEPGHGSPAVVNLRVSFSPSAVRLRAGQQFQVVVSPAVKATAIPWPGACPAGTARTVAGGLLSARCLTDGRYLYTALRAGTTIVSATVRPRCAPGSICPTWITDARLTVVIS